MGVLLLCRKQGCLSALPTEESAGNQRLPAVLLIFSIAATPLIKGRSLLKKGCCVPVERVQQPTEPVGEKSETFTPLRGASRLAQPALKVLIAKLLYNLHGAVLMAQGDGR